MKFCQVHFLSQQVRQLTFSHLRHIPDIRKTHLVLDVVATD
jgi:hypothetical protein